jgi:hypothetical protein
MNLARYADQGSKFLQCIVTRMKHGLITLYPKQTKKIHDVQTTVISVCKEIQSKLYK